MESDACNEGAGEALKNEVPDDCSVRAFFSNDFEWETLRAEIEDSPREECPIPPEAIYLSLILESWGNDERYFPEDEVPAFEIDYIYLPEPCYDGCSACTTSASAFGKGKNVSLDFPNSAWEAFHKNHSTALFFKERRYLVKEFPELLSANCSTARILEVGCGTGSSVVPILRANEKVTIFGCDCSPFALQRAVEVVTQKAVDFAEQKRGELNDEEQSIWCTHSEISSSQPCRLPPEQRCQGGVNIATLIFTLSSIQPASMHHVMTEIASVLQPGGWLLFRDYGLYDLTMLRFSPSQKVSERLYHRKDGTLSYFFSLKFVRDLFTNVGLVEDELHYCCVQLRNRTTQLVMKRVWVHAKFRKPGDLNHCSVSGAKSSSTSSDFGSHINAEL